MTMGLTADAGMRSWQTAPTGIESGDAKEATNSPSQRLDWSHQYAASATIEQLLHKGGVGARRACTGSAGMDADGTRCVERSS